MGLEKIQLDSILAVKYSDYNTIMEELLLWTYKSSIGTQSPRKKSFLTTVLLLSWTEPGNISIGNRPPPKKSCLWLQHYYGARDLETIAGYCVNVQ